MYEHLLMKFIPDTTGCEDVAEGANGVVSSDRDVYDCNTSDTVRPVDLFLFDIITW